MNVEIITIGDEILIGQIVDTNSAWMGSRLNEYGMEVIRISSISDKKEEIVKTLDDAAQRADIVLVTGGLGPTKDDITKHTLCEYFNTELVFSEEVLKDIENLLKPRGVVINQLNRDQALVPKSCKVVRNPVGTAPAMWFEKNNTIFVSMPGVPFEMKQIMEQSILPELQKRFHTNTILHRTILTHGIAESMLAEKLETWENALPKCISLAYLPSPGLNRLRLTARGENHDELESIVDFEVKKLYQIIPEHIFGEADQNMAQVVGDLLKNKNQTLSTAESCTGGNIAHVITLNSGSSEYFTGSVVAYSNSVKSAILNVQPEILEKHGAVSQQVVEAMAIGVKNRLQTDYAIATSGIAGPTGGTSEKPVGTVWIAIASPNKVYAERFSFGKNREHNIERSTIYALNLLRQMILKENQ